MPSRVFKSSGDMVADRRFDYGRDLQLRGDLAAAADLFTQATEQAPGFVSAWFALGDVSERRGDRDGAIGAFRRAKAADSCDFHGAGLRLMRLNGDPLAAMPPGYVTALYDQYAPKFEASLVGDLGYRGPDLLFKAVLATCVAQGRPASFHCAIDLGCGTGLAARAFAALTDEIIGIDLSPGMIQQARATGLYHELEVADAAAGLTHRPDVSVDLILAADMMIYLHDLAPLIGEAGRVLKPGGVFAFTAETHDGAGVILGAGLRYAQSEAHFRELLSDAGLVVEHVDHGSIRNEREMPVPSLVMVASRP
ncbi:methyltransferase domain-containing protein [Tardiphaga sp. P9-11]|jgi:predicted TPR repeat methyltransferase|uniref:class I SAM-dependent DNA methyltransferase n=1 Tax=Tardiphaga sp. P9-11 TaxID=2024614 RepID=UPI0011F3C9C4|nr:methyltransferase domain-containing protein [Tardiphaga sp. P9-11]KAA0077538.1 methyltransferase domain-containing protein [Tardiphaga sp. P9-11]